MKTKIKLRSSFVCSIAAIFSISMVLFVGTACQTKKGAKGPDMVGDEVNMAELRHVIQTRIPDPARSAALMNMVAHAESELGAINEDFIKYSKKFGKVTANHSKGANDLHYILQEWEAQSSNRRLRLTEVLLAMKDYASKEEWPAISGAFMNSVTRQSDRYTVLQQSSNS